MKARNLFRLLLTSTSALTLAAALSVPGPSQAQAVHPAHLAVESVTVDMIDFLKKNRETIKKNPELLEKKLEADLYPKMDFAFMTKLAAGKHWRRASIDEKKALVREFRNLLVNSYAGSLNQFKDQKLKFLPTRAGNKPDRASVKADFIDGSRKTRLEFRTIKRKGKWRLYDLAVENISLITNYRSTFSNQISRSGFKGLIQTLAAKNAEFAARGFK